MEIAMAMAWRGERVSRAARRADLVLVDVRYDPEDGAVRLARGYERRGDVWSDLVILDRAALIDRIRRGKKTFTGRAKDLPGDFEILSPVTVGPGGDALHVGSNDKGTGREDLGLPVF
jgi:hypothetical protein